MKETVIEINNLTKEIKGDIILNNINLNIKKNKIYGIIGHNGCGKSMLFKAICGLIKPTKGNIFVNEKEIGKDTSFPENVGVLIEDPGFIPNYTAVKNLKLLAAIQGKIGEKEIKDSLIKVGLDPNNKKGVKKYSLGMKQKLGIAQAIMEDPSILILDEPMNGLDFDSVKNIRNLILDLKRNGKTILLTSHNKEDIDILCDELFKMDKGTLQTI